MTDAGAEEAAANPPPRPDPRSRRVRLASAWRGLLWARHFADIERFCLFIGYPRSGHSVIGALLDAHPEVVISHELDALLGVRAGLSRRQLYALILDRSRRTARTRSLRGGYQYEVPGQWQGKARSIRVIGDKHGGGAVVNFAQDPQLLHRLRATVQVPLRVLHVTRNPFDNIATFVRRSRAPAAQATDIYFSFARGIALVRQQLDADELCELRQEDFIAQPSAWLRTFCAFLGVAQEEEYIQAAARIVLPRPSRTRDDVDWPDGLRDQVEERAREFDFLAGYFSER